MGPVEFKRFGADKRRYHVQEQHKGNDEGSDDQKHHEWQKEPPGIEKEPICDR